MPLLDKFSEFFVSAMPSFNDGREQELHNYVFSQDLSKLRNNPNAVLKVIDDFDKHEKGLMTFQPRKLVVSRQALDRLQHKPKVLVEMGVYVGVSQSQQMMLQKPDRWQQFSAVAWGAMLRDINAGCDEDCKVYACELDPEFARIARDFVELAGLQDIVKVLEGLATESVARLKSEGSLSSLDVLFLDHWQDAYLPDLRFCERLGIFRSGSIVIADNTDWPGAPDYLSYVRAGGSGAEGGIRYRTKTYETEAEGHKSTKDVEVTTVVG